MQLTARTVTSLACGLALLAHGAAALAADQLIPAKISLVKPEKLAKFVSKNASGFTLPQAATAEDPTTGGAELTFFDTAFGGAGSATFTLDASGWTALGNPAGSKGYKYKGKDDVSGGACSSVQIKEGVIKGVCKGVDVTLTTPFTATEGIILSIPAGTTAAIRYCAEAGGEEKKNDATAMKRKNAAAPAACPDLPQPTEAVPDLQDLLDLTDDALLGRNNNTPGSLLAQDILIRELEEMGAVGLNGEQLGDDAFKQPFTHMGSTGVNILALLPGSELPNEYVMVGAHYDHLSSCRNLDPMESICNGATDNATGVVATLGIGRAIAALPTRPKRSVILAFWDAEEDGLRGSAYYVNNPIIPLAQTVSYINYDIQGANLLPSIKNTSFAVGSETGSNLGSFVTAASAFTTLDVPLLSSIFGQFRSDYINFINAGVPTVFFSDSTGPCYHSDNDEVAIVDFAKLEQQTRMGYDVTVAVADTATPPTYLSPNPNLATFADAVVIDTILTAGLADLALFSPADQMALMQTQATINAIVADGEANFELDDINTLLFSVVDVIDLLTRTACDGFF